MYSETTSTADELGRYGACTLWCSCSLVDIEPSQYVGHRTNQNPPVKCQIREAVHRVRTENHCPRLSYIGICMNGWQGVEFAEKAGKREVEVEPSHEL
jgi:hypothetical protein